jgi:hypothetical protein
MGASSGERLDRADERVVAFFSIRIPGPEGDGTAA